jgi:hypothetical protein
MLPTETYCVSQPVVHCALKAVPFDPYTAIKHSHVVILGAGASRASFPDGDANGKRLPVMADLLELLELRPLVAAAGFEGSSDFEAIYDKISNDSAHVALKTEIEAQVKAYFRSAGDSEQRNVV